MLVAEDEESVRVLIRTVLTDAGFRVLEAASGSEAAAHRRSRSTQPDRPADHRRRDARAWSDPTWRSIVLRSLSADAQCSTSPVMRRHAAVPAGFLKEDDALMQKPFLPEQLLAKVHERLDGVVHEQTATS